MATLNVTANGVSADLPVNLSFDLNVDDLKRIAREVIGSGGAPGLGRDLPPRAFEGYVVDRFGDAQRVYLRPKVPFG